MWLKTMTTTARAGTQAAYFCTGSPRTSCEETLEIWQRGDGAEIMLE
jgi:hypothetical protein